MYYELYNVDRCFLSYITIIMHPQLVLVMYQEGGNQKMYRHSKNCSTVKCVMAIKHQDHITVENVEGWLSLQQLFIYCCSIFHLRIAKPKL